MFYKLKDTIREMQVVMDMWEFMSRRHEFNDEEGPEKWTEDRAREHYGTWVDEDGDERVCLSAAEQTCAKLISDAQNAICDAENMERKHRMERDSAKRRIEELEKFAGMTDRELGDYFTKHLEDAQKWEGEETLASIPNFYWHIAKRLSK